MQEILAFFSDLSNNNNREWFEANKTRYKEIQQKFDSFTEELIKNISVFDNSISGLTAKNCTYRIYRDIRFSPNKLPYKTHIGAYICPKGKKSGYAGYYFHLEPKGVDYIGGSLLAVGLHCPDIKIVRSVRDEIYDNGEEFLNAIKEAKGFELDFSNTLKKTPKEFPANSQFDKYLKLKDFTLMEFIPDNIIEKDKLLEFSIKEFKQAANFNKILNRSVQYAFEEI